MRAMVVYESMFGNTQAVAEAIAEGLGGPDVTVVEVGTRPRIPDDVTLLVVGGPTHTFGMTREETRQSAREKTDDRHVVSDGIGIREWLDLVPAASGRAVAVFDTRVSPARVPGSAAKSIARRLRRKGYHVADEPHTFWVDGVKGPLLDGELDKARSWGDRLRQVEYSIAM